jgi:hypothetical protein
VGTIQVGKLQLVKNNSNNLSSLNTRPVSQTATVLVRGRNRTEEAMKGERKTLDILGFIAGRAP